MRVLFHTFVLKGNNIHLETVKGSVCLLGLVNGNAFFSLFHLQRRRYFLGKKKKPKIVFTYQNADLFTTIKKIFTTLSSCIGCGVM